MMKELPKNIQTLLNDPKSVKILATKTSNDMLHTVPLGSLNAPDAKTIAFGKILISETHTNLEKAKKNGSLVSVLGVNGTEAYQVRCKVREFTTAGPLFDAMGAKLKAMNMPLYGVWLLEPVEIINQSPGPNAGKSI